uniref:Uncharacterized protein n=1 Tax=Anguilla anguilla TaxID=7936 RepID=A0A0E9PXB7_ANGAN
MYRFIIKIAALFSQGHVDFLVFYTNTQKN